MNPYPLLGPVKIGNEIGWLGYGWTGLSRVCDDDDDACAGAAE